MRIKYPYYATRDFSRYEYMEMDVYHEGPGGTPNLDYPYFEHHVGRIDMRDSKGNWRPGCVPIIVHPYKHEGRVQLPLFSGPALMSGKNKFSFSDVDVIQITMPRPQKDWIVYIDDLRLVPPAPPVNAYVNPPEPVPPVSLEET
ncbi:MAG: hypothetical protein HYY56_00375, partial [Candidatus Omnitrophica bacterium]|nr:hypothetical protein [Candidatus Omnitrophota bacterium]